MKRSFHIFLFLVAAKLSSFAQEKNVSRHVTWKTYFEPSKENLDEGYIVFEAVVDSGYQMFAQNQVPQLPIGIEIVIRPSGDFEKKGELIAPKPEIAFSHLYNKPVAVYKGKVFFRQKIILKTKNEFRLSATIENEEFSQAEEIVVYKNKMELSVRPPRGVRLRFL